MHPHRVHRAPGFCYRGFHCYFLTICTAHRFAVFTSAAVVDPIRSQLLRTASDCSFATIAYCFMPDHLHVLVQGTSESADLPAFVYRVKQATGRWFKREWQRVLWQVGYYDRVVRDDDATLSIARYIIENLSARVSWSTWRSTRFLDVRTMGSTR
jgi:putative transposase